MKQRPWPFQMITFIRNVAFKWHEGSVSISSLSCKGFRVLVSNFFGLWLLKPKQYLLATRPCMSCEEFKSVFSIFRLFHFKDLWRLKELKVSNISWRKRQKKVGVEKSRFVFLHNLCNKNILFFLIP